MDHAIFRLIAGCLVLGLAVPMAADVVETTDGRRFEGTVRFAGGAVYVASETAPARLTIDQIASLRREIDQTEGLPEAVATGILPTASLLAEYYGDEHLKDMRSVGVIHVGTNPPFTWGRGAPDVYNDAAFATRLTGSIIAPRAGTYRFVQRWFDRAEIGGKPIDSPDLVENGIKLQAGEQVSVLLEKNRLDGGHSTATLLWSIDRRDSQPIPPDAYRPPDDLAERLTTFHLAQFRDGPGGLKGEYFTDPEMKDRKLVIMEPDISHKWNRARDIHPAFEAGFAARWTGKLKAPKTATATFRVSPRTRLWIDGKKLLDAWPDGEHHDKDRIAKLDLHEGKLYDIRVEFLAHRGGGDLVRVHWDQEGRGNRTISNRWLYPPSDVPRARIILPVEMAAIDASHGATFMLAALPGKGTLRKAEIITEDHQMVLGESTRAPFHVTIRPEQAGITRLRARVTDTAGNVALSDALSVSIVRAPSSELPAPWSISRVGDSRAPLVAVEDDRMKVTGHQGRFGEKTQLPFVSRPLGRDQQFIARLVELTGDEPDTTAMAGITLRQGLQSSDAHLTLLATHKDGWYAAHTDRLAEQSFISKPLPPLPVWMRITRSGSLASVDHSPDGREWTRAGTIDIGNDEQLHVGLTAIALNQAASVIGVFDNLLVRAGDNAYLATQPGLQLTNGSILYGRVTSNDTTHTVRTADGRQHAFPRASVARILYGAVRADTLDQLPRGWRGAVVDGDQLEGEVSEAGGEGVTVRSILFGIRRLSARDGLAAAVLNDVAGDPRGIVVRHRGGRALATDLRLNNDRLVVSDPALGEISLGIEDLAAIERPGGS